MAQSPALQKLIEELHAGKQWVLGVGPMSLDCVNAAIRVSEERRTPLMMICSRRQVEAALLGGGYTEKGTTEEFAAYVKEKDRGGWIVLSRDHGGPWQNLPEWEGNYSEDKALESSLESFKADIDAGFDILHIDTGVTPQGEPEERIAVERLLYLYEKVSTYAKSKGRSIAFEIGTEDQRGTAVDPSVFEPLLAKILMELEKKSLPKPLFVVVQTATKVVEDKNVGNYCNPLLRDAIEKDLEKVLQLCRKYGIFAKAHNCDYMDEANLELFSRVGIPAINIAPEFGVTETRRLLELFLEFNLTDLASQLTECAVRSGKWKRWVVPGAEYSSERLALFAGHYVFSDPQIKLSRGKLAERMAEKGRSLDQELKAAIEAQILRYTDVQPYTVDHLRLGSSRVLQNPAYL